MLGNDLPDQNMLLAGDYRVGVKNVSLGIGKESGVGYLKFEYQITNGANNKRIVFDNISLSSKALWRVKSFLEAIDSLNIELPIEKGADGVYIITDEKLMANTIIENSLGKELMISIVEVPENKEKGWPAKNNVEAYAPCSAKSKWDE